MPSNLQDLIGFWNSQSPGGDNDAARKRENIKGSRVKNGDYNFRLGVSKSGHGYEKFRGGDRQAEKQVCTLNIFDEKKKIKSCKPEETHMPDIVINDSSYDGKNKEDLKDVVNLAKYKGLKELEDDSRYNHKKDDENISPFEKFRKLDHSNKRNTNISVPAAKFYLPSHLILPKSPVGASPIVYCSSPIGSRDLCPPSPSRSTSAAKEIILTWVQKQIKEYPIKVSNFSSSWSDGLAFCYLIHSFFPESFEWTTLSMENRKENLTLAFKKAEELADICPLLDVEDILKFEKPDWKCIFTYVQSFYKRFRNVRYTQIEKEVGAATEER